MTEKTFIRRMYTADNLPVLQSMPSASVDLIYLDPPFNSNRNYAAPVTLRNPKTGKREAHVAAFQDTWTFKDEDAAWLYVIQTEHPTIHAVIESARQAHSEGMAGYLCMMAVRLLEMRRVLKSTGSIYLHCDPTAGPYLRLTMDAVFGAENFRSEITWKRTSSHSDTKQGRKQHGRIRDLLLFYTKSGSWTWNPVYTEYDPEYVDRFYRYEDPPKTKDGKKRRYRLGDITGPGGGEKGSPYYEVMGVKRYWRYSQERMQQLIAEGRIVQTRPGAVPAYKRYLDEMPGVPIQDLWGDIHPVAPQAKERTGYPTQKPLALLERIIAASSNAGDLVLDPFAGCATACVAAEKLGRQWIGIDVSDLAVKLVRERIQDGYNRKLFSDPLETGFHPDKIEHVQISGTAHPPSYKDRKPELYVHQKGICAGCGLQLPERLLTVDHIKPQSQGGGADFANLQLLCSDCNSRKGNRDMAYLMESLKKDGIIP